MHLPYYIAKRYLFAKKSHNVINLISIISAVGIGIGCMALIIILSVYNGFDDLIKSLYNNYQPDIIVTPVNSKSFSINTPEFDKIKKLNIVFSPSIEENVFVLYDGRQAIAALKGIDSNYLSSSKLKDYITEGTFNTQYGDISEAVISKNLASQLGIRVRFISPIELYFPNRNATFSTLNPMASLSTQKFFPSGIITLEDNFDKNNIFVSIEKAAELVSYNKDVVTSVNIYLKHGEKSDLRAKISDILGENFIVKDHLMQNDTLFKMMRSEKFAVYLILFFIIAIVSFNVFGSLSMLILDKRDDIAILKSMGAEVSLIKRIFVLQGFFISLIGALIGIIVGIIISYAQYRWGFISMPGNFIVNAYPIKLQFIDIIITFTGVSLIGYAIANIPVKNIKKNY